MNAIYKADEPQPDKDVRKWGDEL